MQTVVDAKHICRIGKVVKQEQIAFADVFCSIKLTWYQTMYWRSWKSGLEDECASKSPYPQRRARNGGTLGSRRRPKSRFKIDPEFLNETAHEHDETVASVALVESAHWIC